MNHLHNVVRIAGVLLALFLVLSAYLTISGINYSEDVPPLSDRILSTLPALLLSLVLLTPQRLFLHGVRFRILGTAYLIATSVLLYAFFRDAWEYKMGLSHWMIITMSAVALLTVLFNGLVLRAQRRALPPNKSFKPTPLRGAA